MDTTDAAFEQLAEQLFEHARVGQAWSGDPVPASALARAVRMGVRRLNDEGGNRLRFKGQNATTPLQISGDLRLNSLNGSVSLSFEHCVFEDGKVDLSGAQIGQLRFESCQLREVELSDLGTSGLLSLQNCVIRGVVTLMDAKIDGMLAMEGTRIHGAKKRAERTAQIQGEDTDLVYALDARNIVVAGSVNLSPVSKGQDPFFAEGKVSFRASDIEGHLNMQSAQFDADEAAVALDMNGVRVAKSVYFNIQASARGLVDLRGAVIGGQLNMRDSQFKSAHNAGLASASQENNERLSRLENKHHVAIHANGMEVGRQLILARSDISGDVILTGARCAELWDAFVDHRDAKKRRSWSYPREGRLWIHGFSYDRIQSDCVVSAKERIQWLKEKTPGGKSSGFSPQPYTQLATVMASMGHEQWARQIYLAREGARRKGAPFLSRTLGQLYNSLVGSGYQPWRGVIWLLTLVALGALIFASNTRNGRLVPSETYALFQMERQIEMDGKASLPPGYSCPNPWLYSLDVALPIVDLRQEHYWKASAKAIEGLCTTTSALPFGVDATIGGWITRQKAWAGEQIPEPVQTALAPFTPRSWVRLWYWFQTLMGAMLVALTGLSFSGILKRD